MVSKPVRITLVEAYKCLLKMASRDGALDTIEDPGNKQNRTEQYVGRFGPEEQVPVKRNSESIALDIDNKNYTPITRSSRKLTKHNQLRHLVNLRNGLMNHPEITPIALQLFLLTYANIMSQRPGNVTEALHYLHRLLETYGISQTDIIGRLMSKGKL
jgi:hypothetical protein